MEKKKTVNSNIISVYLQIIITCVLVIVGIITLFRNSLFPILEIVMALDLLIVAYNNYKIYHKKKLTIVYLLFAILLILFGILSLGGVI